MEAHFGAYALRWGECVGVDVGCAKIKVGYIFK